MIWLQSQLDDLEVSQEVALYHVFDGLIRERLTRVSHTAIVIQAMARGGDREWVLAQGVPEGTRSRQINARISDARRVLARHGIENAQLPASPAHQEAIRSLLRG